MGGELRYEIEQDAYIKLVLHALKHKTSAVNGVLLGNISGTNNVVQITDSVPLFHSHIGLLPQLEISLILIEECYASKGLNIVGYFHANERFDDYELSGIAKNIGDHITRYFPQAAILLLDNRKLASVSSGKDWNPVMQVGQKEDVIERRLVDKLTLISLEWGKLKPPKVYTKDSSKNWKLVGSDESSQLSIKQPSANVVLSDYISSERWQDVVDFDDHLDDISRDWLNPDLFK